jgi:hemolysin activation/secretion protein
MFSLQMNAVRAQVLINGGAADREVQGGATFGVPPEPLPGVSAPQGPPMPATPSPALTLPSPISRVQVEGGGRTLEARKKATGLIDAFRGKTVIEAGELDRLRGEIWRLYRARGRMAYVEAEIASHTTEEGGGSSLHVQIIEVLVHEFRVESAGVALPPQSILAALREKGTAIFASEVPLNLDAIDSFLKRRMYMEDVNLRLSLQPKDSTHVDVVLLVSRVTKPAVSGAAQFDNTGGRSLGPNRLMPALSFFNAGALGARLDLTAMGTQGLRYGNAKYDFPIPAADIRVAPYVSYTDYRTVLAGVPTGTGNALEWGVEAARPLVAGQSLWVTGFAGYVDKRAQDSVAGVQIDDKHLQEAHMRAEFEWVPAPAHRVSGGLSAIGGNLDLSANAGSFAQDQAGPRTNGRWSKETAEVRWQWNFAPRIDASWSVKGQHSSKNLDSLELFTLGGANDLRGFGPGEARGDGGGLTSFELGYDPASGVRIAPFYDWGRICSVENPFIVEAVPNTYSLQDAGISLSATYRRFSASAVYAHQIGSNPGLFNGLDSDGLSRRYRAWFVLSYRL